MIGPRTLHNPLPPRNAQKPAKTREGEEGGLLIVALPQGERGILFLIIPEGGNKHPKGDGAHPEGGEAPRGMGAVSRGVFIAS